MKKKVFSLMMTLVLGFMGLTQAMAQADFPMVFDFEDNTVPATWVNDSVHPWVVYKLTAPDTDYPGYSGSYYLKSGNAGVNSSTSAIEATVEFPNPGKVSFLGGCYGETSFGTMYDKCQFYIDGEVQFTNGALGSWDAYEYTVAAGSHTFKWVFTKDSSTAGAGDFFGIDDVKFEVIDVCADLPTNSYFKYNVSQQIFTADQLGDLANLGSVKFYNAGDELTRKLDVYVTTTDKESFESETDWMAVDTTNLVFSGDVTFGSFAWTTINFNAPLTIEEGLNVVVTVDDNTDIAIAGLNFSMDTVDAGGNVALYYHSDDTTRFNPDPTDLSTITGTLLGKRNEVEFGEFEFTIYDGTVTSSAIPAYCSWFDSKTTAQHVIPAADLALLNGLALNGLTWYSTRDNVPFTTTEEVTIYMKEVDFTTFPNPATTAAFVPQAQCQVVYTGKLNIVAADGGGQCVITFNQPYTYNGGNLLIGVEDTPGGDFKFIYWLGQTVNGASIHNYGSSRPTHANFLPKTTFSFGAEAPVVFEPNLYMIDMTDSTFVDTLNFGARPNGYWMRPVDIYSLWNHTGNAINVSRFDFTPEEGFFTAEAIDNELAFQMAIDDTIPMLFTSNVTDTTFADTTFTRQFVVIYDAARTAGVWPVVMTAYNAVEPDVFELARVVDTFPYIDTLDVAAIPLYDNYRLPDATIEDGPDAVYVLTIDKDVLLNASVIEGDNGKVALYTEDFYNYGGPDMENYYNGPQFGGQVGFEGDEFAEGFEDGLNGWTVLNVNTNGGEWLHSSEHPLGYDYTELAHAGTGLALSYSFVDYVGSFNTNSYLVSPQSYAIGTGSMLKFFYDYANDDYPDFFEVCVSTAANPTAADFTSVWSVGRRGNNANGRDMRRNPNRLANWREVTINLSAYQGQNVWIAFHHEDYDMYEVWIDDVTLGTNDAPARATHPFTATPIIQDMPLTAGTYYLVASSTSPEFVVEIDTVAMPCPEMAEIVSPADDADDIQIGSGIELKWKLDGYATEYCLLFGSTYYCEDTLVGWTSDLAESFVVPANYPLYHNTNYFWKVCQRNSSCGTGTDGEVWGFTTTFNAPTNLHATDTSIFEGDDVVMEWTAIEDRTFRSYNVYLNDEYIGSTTTTPNPTTYLTYTIADSLLTYNMNPGHKVEVTAYYDEGESPKSEPYYIKVSGYGKITGKVYEQDGTTGIKNARVYITGVNEFGEPVEMDTVTTSNNGRYTINRVPVSGDSISYQAFAEKEGYQSPVEPIEGNPRAVAYRGTTQANFILDEVFAPVPPCAVFAEFYPDPEVEDEYVKVTWTMNGGESVDIDFETNDFSQGTFDNTVSSYPWVLTTDNVHGGTYAMKSSNAGVASSTSAIEATVTLSYDGSVSFWALCQGEGTSSIWDHCIFKIDGVEKFNYGANVTGWNEYTYDLTAGTHTLRWEYTKDSSVNPTGDGMWVDDIHFGSAPGGREVAEDRSFKYYRIYRTSCYNDGPYNSENTVLLGNNDTPADLEFVDVNWKTVGPGVYKWGVSRVYEGNREDYPNGRESEISWTCECIDKDMYLNNVRVTVLLNSADSPEGTTVSFTNLNEVEEQNHPMGTITLDETGYYKFGADNPFRKGDYVVSVEHEGYISETDTVSIWSNKHLRYVLTEIIYGTRDAYVSRTGWAMWDDALTGGNVPGGGGGGSFATITQGFEDGLGDWTMVDCDLYSGVVQSTDAAHSGLYGFDFNYTYNPPQYLISPELGANNGVNVSFFYKERSTVFPETFRVGYSTTTSDASAFTFEAETGAGTDWAEYTTTFPAGTKYIAIQCTSYNAWHLFIDDITISDASRGDGNRVASATGNTRHLEGYKVMCTNSFGEPIFNENTPHKFCQVATDRLVEGQKYYFQVAAIYSTGMSPYCDPVEWEYESCENYADIPIEGETTLAGNVISWLGGTPGPGPGPGPQPTGDATIILTVGDVWGDGTGYQMLLDADATAYGNEIPTSGPYTLGNYDAFEYKIPENADCNTTTSNIVFNNSVTITVPAGTYDWCITNPEPYGNMWIAADNGNVGGRQNDYVFEAGMTYEFVPAMFGQNDGVNVTVTGGGKNLRSPLPAGECRENKNHVASAAAPVANGTLPGMSNGNFAPLQSGPFRGATGYANCVYSMTWPNAYVSFDVDAPGTATNVSTVNINRGGDYADGFFYGFNDAGVFYKLNYETGAVIEQHTTSGALTEMSYNYANNTMYGISNAVSGNSQLVTVDLANGNTTPIGTGLGVSIMAFAIDLNGNAYGISITDGNFYTIDLATGTATMVGSTGKAVNYVQCMNFDHNTETLYWFQISGATDCALYSVNTTNGACTLVMNTPGEVTSFAVPFEGTPGPGPGPQPTPEGVIGYMLFRDGEWLAELPVDVTSYLDAEGGAHDYTMRVIYGGEAVLPSNNYNYAMSCGSTIELGYDVVCAPGDPISGDYYYESDSDFGAIISWEPQPEPPTPPTPPTAEATIILTVGDVWGDGTGYQMLLDADATAYGNEIPTTGPYTLGNYDAFEYKIPVNADCNTYTSNIVFNNSIAITVPAGTYDWCITNPEPGGNMWIASDNGTAGGRKDNYVFEAGMTYEFVPAMFGQNDGVNVTITPTGTKSRAALVGYNIYRSTTNSNYELVGTAAADATEYRDNVAAGNYFYQVTAVYDNDCESAPAANADDASLNYVVVEVTSVDDNTNRVALYPNPTNGLVKIEANGMRHITVVNALGQVVFDNDITGDEYQINMAQFNAGVYVVRIATENGVSTQRVTVVR